MVKKRNLIWIVVDGVRSYRTGLDDRDRIDIMDKLALESVEFTNAIASAPSTILSGAAMFTGMPSCFVARHFDDWQFDNNYIISVQEILSKNGYTNYSIHNSKEDREVMKDLLLPLDYKYYPKGISHGVHWTNYELNLVLENLLEHDIDTPGFFMLWYDCREDPEVSKHVEDGLNMFKSKNLYDDSIIILTSDHGYPDPSSGVIQSRGRSTRHDLVVTDDNIRVPLLIKYPGCGTHKVNHNIGLINLFPTILDILDIKSSDPRMKNVMGKSLFPLLKNPSSDWESQIVRVDTRLSLATDRITALRSDSHKYVYYHDEEEETLYDLKNDPQELYDLLESPSKKYEVIKAEFRKYFKESQLKVDEFHHDELVSAFEKNIKSIKENNINDILFLSTGPVQFIKLITKLFRKTYPNISIDFIKINNQNVDLKIKPFFDNFITDLKIKNSKTAKIFLNKKDIKKYDYTLMIREKSNLDFDDPVTYKISTVLGRKRLMVTYNMKFYNRFIALWVMPLRKYKRNWEFYKHEPFLLFKDLYKLFKNGVNYLILKKKVVTPKMKTLRDYRQKILRAQQQKQ